MFSVLSIKILKNSLLHSIASSMPKPGIFMVR